MSAAKERDQRRVQWILGDRNHDGVARATDEHVEDKLYSFTSTVSQIDVFCITVGYVVSLLDELGDLLPSVLVTLRVRGVST